MTERISKQAMIDQIEDSYAAFEAGLAALEAGRMTAPTLPGGWSIKDTLAHLDVWQRRALDMIEPIEPPRVPGVAASGIDDENIDTFNAQFYAAARDVSLPEALAGFRESYRQLLECAQRLSDDDLTRVLVDETRTWQVVAANTYWHYPEHLQAIQAAFPGA